jgi:hypothetical protein
VVGLVISNGPTRVGISLPSHEDGKRIQFPKWYVLLYFLEHQTTNKSENPVILSKSHKDCLMGLDVLQSVGALGTSKLTQTAKQNTLMGTQEAQ